MDLDGVDDRSRRATSVLSMDDIEAAQALEGLRSDYQSPRTSSQHSPRATMTTSVSTSDSNQPEPLLSLLTSTHPLISSAINGSMSAYTSSKSYSPRFRYGAEFIERTIGSPVANTVHTVGRKTGVESGLRWALQRRGSASVEAAGPTATKRRKVDTKSHFHGDVDVEKGLRDDGVPVHRTRSVSDLSLPESLPPYDDLRSPSYEDLGNGTQSPETKNASRQVNPTWQNRLMISTSGLGVAMSEESMRSLQYCLTWLRWANGRLGKSIVALKGALQEWEKSTQENDEDVSATSSRNNLLTQRIQAVREDVLATLKQVVDIISKYAGGALPENARNLVRRHLTSLPQRFQIASTSNPPPNTTASASDVTVSAHRILVLAQEGLDMMAQVNSVVNDTLVSAEHWCSRLGKRSPQARESEAPSSQPAQQSLSLDEKLPTAPTSEQDVHMGGIEKA
ncbi:hypothetical protein ASPZODRAFT_62206 [Penicilliopsis zonata CBS 506.65]|uniref:Clock-controlled protein 8 n=1 Tax=Penicilliopsis zonata CBS 506.65 TaxID=1073090 RepID=A0A1L9SMU8_9EURO|nr:hypothetical protein ASPZODRAFT_62206 [Penicilliopsis zonata CBS 506.65]OJJ48421.1 hypothetical protein ASPZODRAFT_62206 [Penicilliopsis zonata CBS 506.65]